MADISRALLAAVTDKAARANHLNSLSNCLRDAGDGAGALAAIREAVEIRRKLARDIPARFASALERSLAVLSRLEPKNPSPDFSYRV